MAVGVGVALVNDASVARTNIWDEEEMNKTFIDKNLNTDPMF